MKKVVLVTAIVLIALVAGYVVAARAPGFPLVLNDRDKLSTGKTLTYSLGQFITNLMDSGKYIRVTLDLKILDSRESEDLLAKVSELKTDIYALLRSKTYEELIGETGLRSLQQDILDRIEAKCPGIVEDVFFSEFIIQ
ncbi:MAG TPA: flagellar basal body-associated FliL family protein [Firmicutes bacterium]|jgi:flagellar basal body-associated protein FliL|nr:flagellar basal body-associated FliL family protein [Bacillota bacterium]